MKRALSLFIVFCLIFSLIPTVFASDPETDVQLIGKYSREEYKDRKTYNVTVPAALGPGQYSTVVVSGGVPGGYTLHVSAADTVTLTYNNQTITLDVYFEPLAVVGSDLDEVSASGKVSLEDRQVAFGTWSGHFSYSVNLIENGNTSEIIDNSSPEEPDDEEVPPSEEPEEEVEEEPSEEKPSDEEPDDDTPSDDIAEGSPPVDDIEVTPEPEDTEDKIEEEEDTTAPTVQIATIDASAVGYSNINIPFMSGMTWSEWLSSFYSANVLNENGDNITIKYDENTGCLYVEEYSNARIYISADSFDIYNAVINSDTIYKLSFDQK